MNFRPTSKLGKHSDMKEQSTSETNTKTSKEGWQVVRSFRLTSKMGNKQETNNCKQGEHLNMKDQSTRGNKDKDFKGGRASSLKLQNYIQTGLHKGTTHMNGPHPHLGFRKNQEGNIK